MFKPVGKKKLGFFVDTEFFILGVKAVDEGLEIILKKFEGDFDSSDLFDTCVLFFNK